MRKTILLATLTTSLLLTTTACTNNLPTPKHGCKAPSKEQIELQDALSNYTHATLNNDVDTLVSFVYPKVFTLVPKEKMTSMLTEMYASGKAPNIKEIQHINLTPITKYDQGTFSIITSVMSMELNSPRQDPNFEAFMLDMLKKKLGENSKITLDAEKHQFLISNESKIIGINEGTEGWKFVGYDQAKQYASKNILPKEITDTLK